MMLENDKIVIVGCGRSGTGYAAKTFTLNGKVVGHERLKRDGISDWYLTAKPTDRYQRGLLGPTFPDVEKYYKDFKIIHQVRNPILCMNSLFTHNDTTWLYISSYTKGLHANERPLIKHMKHWVTWNLMAEELAEFTYQLEKFDETFNLPIKNNEKYNARKHIGYPLQTYKDADSGLFNDVEQLSKKYGYSF